MRLSICIPRKLRGNGSRKTERRKEFPRGPADGTSSGRTSTAIRLHGNLSLHLSTTDDGAGAPDRLPEDQGVAHRRRALQPRGAILGADFRDQFCSRRCYGNPNGISVRDELGAFFESGGRLGLAAPCDWSRVFLSFPV